jgi:hypothetical protein
MIALLCLFLTLFASPFKSKSRLEAENAALRYQLIVLQRRVSGRVQLTNGDRLFLVMLYRWFPSVLKAITIIRPETLVRWHRAGFRRYWRWKSRALGGRPKIDAEVHGAATRRRLRAMGIRDKPIAPGSPWQNGFAERLIGSIRRECTNHAPYPGAWEYRGHGRASQQKWPAHVRSGSAADITRPPSNVRFAPESGQ